MSASDPKSKIDLIDTPEQILDKLKGAYCLAGELADNGVLAFLKQVIMPMKEDRSAAFVVSRPAKYGGDLSFKNYADIERAFVNKELHPLDLKQALAEEIVALLAPFETNRAQLEKLSKSAYGTVG